MKAAELFMELAAQFAAEVEEEHFQKIFGALGTQLWKLFWQIDACDHDLVYFYTKLNQADKKRLTTAITNWKTVRMLQEDLQLPLTCGNCDTPHTNGPCPDYL